MSDSQDNNKSKFSFDPSTAKPVDTASVAKSDGFTFDPSTAIEDKKGIKGHAQDIGASLMGGLAAVPDTLVGLADMYTEGRAGKAIDDNLGNYYKLGDAQKYWQDQKTNVAKQQQKQFQDAEGVVDKTKIALQNPSMITNAAVESLPSMFLGGALGQATKIANPISAAAVGEGAVMAGAQAEQIRQNSDDKMLNNGQEAAAFGTGIIGGALGAFGGWVANKVFKIADIDTAMQTGRLTRDQIGEAVQQVKIKDIPYTAFKGAVSEGFLEELPQSVSEQIIQNLALDKPWYQGVDDAAVMGTLAGIAMGSSVNSIGKTKELWNQEKIKKQEQIQFDIQENQKRIEQEIREQSERAQQEVWDKQDSQTQQARTQYFNERSQQVQQDDWNREDIYNNQRFLNQPTEEMGDKGNLIGFNNQDLSGPMDNSEPNDPDKPPSPNGLYLDEQINTFEKPSERLGLNPDNGPMSSAAALAVDNGASQSVASLHDAASTTSSVEQDNAGTIFSDNTAQAIQYGMGEIAQGAKEAALENTIKRLEKDGEVQLFKEDSIVKALEDQNYNVRLNNDGSASIIGVKNPATNQWHGIERTDLSTTSTPTLNMADTQDQSLESNTSQELATLQQRFDEAKTVPEKAKIRKEINQLQNNQLQLGSNSNERLQTVDGSENRNSEVPDSTGNQFTTTSNTPTNDVENVPNENANKPRPFSNDVTNQINQLEQKLPAAKSVPQKAKIRNQINQLKSQQIESSEKPQNTVLNPEQIKTQYGDAPESVMSDIEILGDDFTIDLREDNKKSNALNNPNYNAVQKADGSVEIVGMKHPTTGEWVGKMPIEIGVEDNAFQAEPSLKNNNGIIKPLIVNKVSSIKEQKKLDSTLNDISTMNRAQRGYDLAKKLGNQIIYSDNKGRIDTADIVLKIISAKGHDFFLALGTDKESLGKYKVISKDGLTVGGFHRSEADAIKSFNKKIESVTDQQLQEAFNKVDKIVQDSGKSQEDLRQKFEQDFYKRKIEPNKKFEKQISSEKENKTSKNPSQDEANNINNQDISAKNDSHKPLYSRSNENNTGSTIQQVRDVLIKRFGKDTIKELERQGKLEIIQEYSVDGVEGFYHNGKAVLVASNLTNESAIPTFLHELGGHAGFQNMMNQEQYNELMRQFDKLVEQGNPVAMAAKILAEREQGSVRQQLEYLPYLLTLSSTMQQRNIVHRNALKKLIQNIVSYVKAWAFDNFGINLNLNPDDILALSERMVEQIEHQSSLDTVRQKYQGTSQWKTAPNGAKTNLTEQQWLQVRTPEFKKWFGDWENDPKNASQVLDENGEPKIVYHGTNKEFNEFRKGHGLLGDGIYLTDSFDTADMYANNRGKNGFVLPLFVNIRTAFKTKGNISRDQVIEATDSGKYQGVVHQFEDQEFIVALEPNQVKIAEGNTGTFNSESADIRFSRSSNYDDITNRIANGFKILPKTGDWINKKGVDWLKIGLGLLSRRHLTEVYGKLLPQLNKYNELAAQMDADKNDIAAEADNIVREWSKLKDEETLANVMHEATLAQIDPAKPYQQGDNKVKYQQLLHAYNNLSPESQEMYKKARNAYSKHYAKVREAIRERIIRSALSSQKKADLLKNIEGSFGQIKGVYFPLARFGEYIIVMRNKNGDVESVSRAETYSEAESVRSELMKKYQQFKVDKVKLDKEYSASRDGVGRGFMSELFNEVENLGLSAESLAEFEDTLSQLYLSSMPDLSWAKHGIHRKGTAGFSQDARRAFAQHMFSGANYLGKLRYGDQLAQELTNMQKHADDEFNKDIGYDQRSAQRVISEMEKRHELLMNPKGNPLSSFLTSVGFMYYMGLSPAAAMVNLSQTALIAYPIMGAKWGFDKAGKELLKASQDFGIGLKNGYKTPDFSSLEGFKNSVGDIYNPNIVSMLKGDELVAYEEAVKRGVIDVTQAHDLAGIAQGEDSKVMWYFRPAMRLASGMFHHAERFNREVTFIAAYRLARQHVNTNGSKATHSEAFEQAVDAVYKGHFDYSAGNRARFMQGNIAKVVLLFKQYAQNMIYTLVRNAHQSIYALDPKDQKEARRALAGILGMTTLAAGAIGLPITGMLFTASILIAKKSKLGSAAFFAAWAIAFFGAADGDDDDPYELENVIRNWLADINPKFADLVFGGVPRAFSPVDLSGRVGLNNLIFPDVQDGLEGADWAKAMQSALLGPVVGIGTNVAKGFQEINDGDYGRGIETMLPVVLKNAVKSIRFANEGVLTKNKDVIQQDVNGVGIFSQAIGFSPSDVKTSMEGRSAIYKYKTKLENHRKDLMHKWVTARQNDDSDGMDKAWAEIQEFNSNVVENNPSMRINRMNLIQSYKSTERRTMETGDGGVYLTKRQKGAEEQGGFAFNR